MLKEAETEQAIGFAVTISIIGGISVGGPGPRFPPPLATPMTELFHMRCMLL